MVIEEQRSREGCWARNAAYPVYPATDHPAHWAQAMVGRARLASHQVSLDMLQDLQEGA